MTVLLDNVSVDTTSATFFGDGGKRTVYVRADNFGGGTVNIELDAPSDVTAGPRWTLVESGAFTANGQVTLGPIPSGGKVRADLTGSTSPVNVYVEII